MDNMEVYDIINRLRVLSTVWQLSKCPLNPPNQL
jgi:hypothetical protein